MYNFKFILESIEPEIKDSKLRENAKEVMLAMVAQIADDSARELGEADEEKIKKICEKMRGNYSGKI